MVHEEPNPRILLELRRSFDTQKLKDAIAAIDALSHFRQDLEVVYAKARTLIDEVGHPGADVDRRPVWEVADLIMAEVGRNAAMLRDLERALEKLVYLDPKLEAEPGP